MTKKQVDMLDYSPLQYVIKKNNARGYCVVVCGGRTENASLYTCLSIAQYKYCKSKNIGLQEKLANFGQKHQKVGFYYFLFNEY